MIAQRVLTLLAAAVVVSVVPGTARPALLDLKAR
jgi:hypothetical protein